jgi:hypothetical protein
MSNKRKVGVNYDETLQFLSKKVKKTDENKFMARESDILKGKFIELSISQKFLCVCCQSDLVIGKCELWNSKLHFVGVYDGINDLEVLCNFCHVGKSLEFLKQESQCEHDDVTKNKFVKLEERVLLKMLGNFNSAYLKQLYCVLFVKRSKITSLNKKQMVESITLKFSLESVLNTISELQSKSYIINIRKSNFNSLFGNTFGPQETQNPFFPKQNEMASDNKICKFDFDLSDIKPYKKIDFVNCVCCEKEYYIESDKNLFYDGTGKIDDYLVFVPLK